MPFQKTEHSIAHAELIYEEKLGEGSFGKVFKGQWQHSVVAIKKFKIKNFDEATLRELEKESDIMASLRHDNIVAFRGFCSEAPHYAIVMEYMPMGSLYQLLRSEKVLDWETRIQISIGIGAGLVYLHSKDILHRDIKSPNVLIEEKHNRLHPKLTDFGLSKVKTDTMASSSVASFSGTLPWMAPELFDNASYQKSADVYSFAIVLWEIASRKTPFANLNTTAAIVGKILKGIRETIPEETPASFKKIIEKAWKQHPAQRPNAKTIVSQLQFFLKKTAAPKQSPASVSIANRIPNPIPASQPSIEPVSFGLQHNFASNPAKIPQKTHTPYPARPSPIPKPTISGIANNLESIQIKKPQIDDKASQRALIAQQQRAAMKTEAKIEKKPDQPIQKEEQKTQEVLEPITERRRFSSQYETLGDLYDTRYGEYDPSSARLYDAYFD